MCISLILKCLLIKQLGPKLLNIGLASESLSVNQTELRTLLEDFWAPVMDDEAIADIFELGKSRTFPASIFYFVASQHCKRDLSFHLARSHRVLEATQRGASPKSRISISANQVRARPSACDLATMTT